MFLIKNDPCILFLAPNESLYLWPHLLLKSVIEKKILNMDFWENAAALGKQALPWRVKKNRLWKVN